MLYGSSWKLPRNTFVQAAMEGKMEASTSIDSGNLNFHVLPWKLLLTSMEVHLIPLTSMEISTDVYTLPPISNNASMEVMFASIERTFTFMEVNFGSACTSMELDRTEVI